jgi:hypothetical protein
LILVDSNILMDAAGAKHRNKAPSVRLLERIAAGTTEAAVDAEVLQEILHRYRAIHRWDEGRVVYDMARRLFPLVIPITVEVTDRARVILDEYGTMMARDALHAAVVELHGPRHPPRTMGAQPLHASSYHLRPAAP